MLRVQRHLVRSFRPFVARRPCERNFSGQGDEVEEEKEGPYNAETYRKRMHESGKFVDAAEKKTSTVIQTKQHESTTRTHTHKRALIHYLTTTGSSYVWTRHTSRPQRRPLPSARRTTKKTATVTMTTIRNLVIGTAATDVVQVLARFTARR